VDREPTLNELIGDEVTGSERQQLQHVHEMLLESGPPPEISADLERGPTLAMTLSRKPRRRRPRAMILLAAALMVVLVFFAGYSVSNHGKGGRTSIAEAVALQGTRLAPHAQGTLQVWTSNDGSNWPMTLSVAGLPQNNYYEVYLVRGGKIRGSCGMFRVGDSRSSGNVTVSLTSPYQLEQGDSWVVTRPVAGGAEPGPTVLRPTTTA
jgi:hypothetical protein